MPLEKPARVGETALRGFAAALGNLRAAEDRQFARRDFFPRLIVIAAIEQMRFGHLPGDFRERHDEWLGWFCRAPFVAFLAQRLHFLVRRHVEKIKAACIDIEAGIFLEKCVLLGRAFVRRSGAREADRFAQIFRQSCESRGENTVLVFDRARIGNEIPLARFTLDRLGEESLLRREK